MLDLGEKARPRFGSAVMLLSLSLGGLAFSVLQSLVAPALPAIARDLGVSTADASWVVTAYLLSASVLTPVLGRLGDMMGKRMVLLAVLGLLAAGTLLAALATDLATLVVARALQGAAGAIMPLSIGIVRDELPRERVSVVIGLLSAMVGVGAGVGIVAAGPVVDHLSWHWLFWFSLIVIAVALAGAAAGVPGRGRRSPGRLDLPGAALLSVSLVALLLAISKASDWGWGHPATLSLLGMGLLTLPLFVRVERRMREPLIDLRLLRPRGVWAADLVSLLLGFAMFGTFLLVPALLLLPDGGFGVTVTEAGLFLLPTTLTMLVSGPLAGVLVRRHGPRPPTVAGAAAVAGAFVLLTFAHEEAWQVLAAGALTGAGIGLAFAAMPNAIIDAVPAGNTGEATSVNSIARTVGSSLGTAVIALVLSEGSGLAFSTGFAVCAGVGILAVMASFFLPARP
ncbi:MFS transporter [Acrocarpospora pleiomorpha]|uniref:MFS transporter n=1 Tax=Acrocarpospora pleiomorpha TaxID=90975 RepID=A0A5M3XF50_9ACTN|nr:MFS transporter [Acrocarpospora pleiomorpha]GES18759.1 MFS transporter [Acrocarpospora pleiomorpha]